jgi:hypothetical protein
MSRFMPDPSKIIEAYNAITGDRQSLMAWEFKIHQFVQAGYTANDMVGVLRYMLDENKNNPYHKNKPYSMALGPLLDLQRFADLRSRAMQKYGTAKPSNRDKVLASWHGFDRHQDGSARAVAQIMRGMQL